MTGKVDSPEVMGPIVSFRKRLQQQIKDLKLEKQLVVLAQGG